MVDSCYGEDGFFSFDCGVSITWVQCGRGRDTEVFTGLTTSGVSGGASTATASIDPEASDPAAPSTGQSVAGPDETGNADECENDRDSGGGNSNAKTIGLGVGLGVGIPLVLIGAGVLGFCVWRTKRQTGNQYSQPPIAEQQTPDRWTSPSTFVSGNGTEQKHMSELMGAQTGQRYELSPDTNRTSEMPSGSGTVAMRFEGAVQLTCICLPIFKYIAWQSYHEQKRIKKNNKYFSNHASEKELNVRKRSCMLPYPIQRRHAKPLLISRSTTPMIQANSNTGYWPDLQICIPLNQFSSSLAPSSSSY